ncbi:MAG: hypothetical protein A2599_02840 [Candidatus Staskawiczbacteria bacterium RIFOXYD1_FULL_39_28]|uniref:Homing endonuclease LAGLIDADG domain-containing protein n=1 Tax=Candidatus Staskawiczbacteria bacterium RIFOXYC1_FULL_38_18 TaxID=1802229 RepID=A0A1G2JC59_9BACT|nr:MAG: hypothetical protein A2401_01340 [Candidatus Staskawiczbacteria bacterium RIFOXYC1_FULL_38_18]OGZ91047.1 MAG: hypothetical protein A2599_02840 [Candidatus Staskawiczbacteria bacterium RIFOXYD1_FULL_39_28]
MVKEKFSVATIVNSDGCFDLQFRKDTRHKRTNSPTYYRWKAQFVVTAPKENERILNKIKKELCCGEVSISKGQARFSVQKISDVAKIVVPFFKKNALARDKKRDFEMWAKAVEIIQKNKGKYLAAWQKSDLHSLIEIQKACCKYKARPRKSKWLDMAKSFSKSAGTPVKLD